MLIKGKTNFRSIKNPLPREGIEIRFREDSVQGVLREVFQQGMVQGMSRQVVVPEVWLLPEAWFRREGVWFPQEA